jgi:hypothetical protein
MQDGDNPVVNAKFHVIFQDCLNIKQDYVTLSTVFNMKFLNSNKDKLLEKILHVNGNYNDDNSFKEISSFINLIFSIKTCNHCKSLYKCHHDHSAVPLCFGCIHKKIQASKIQKAFRNAIENPTYTMCKNRLIREYNELIQT